MVAAFRRLRNANQPGARIGQLKRAEPSYDVLVQAVRCVQSKREPKVVRYSSRCWIERLTYCIGPSGNHS